MKLLEIIGTVDRRMGGPVTAIERIGELLADHGIEQELLTLDAPGSAAQREFPRKVHALGPARRSRIGQRFLYTPQAIAWGRQHLADYDVAIVHGLWNYGTHVGRRLLAGGALPYAVFPHGMLAPWFAERYPLKHRAKQVLWQVNEGVLVNRADAVLFTCEEERREARISFRPYHPRERVIAFGTSPPPAPEPGEEAAFRAMIPALGTRSYLLFLGRLHEKKGCDLLVEAFAGIAASQPELDLVMAGPDHGGIRAELESRAQALGIGERVHWPGMVEGRAKFGAFRGAEAFVLPSHMENFGIAVAEALSCGCPVLISDQVNIWREIEKAGAGLVAPVTLEGTRRLLTRFLALPQEQRQALAQRGTALFERQFTAKAAAADLAKVLQEISGKQ